MQDKTFVDKVDMVFNDARFDGYLYVTLPEFGGNLRDLSAADSLKRTKHAEAICIKECTERELLTNLKREDSKIKIGYPSYDEYMQITARICWTEII